MTEWVDDKTRDEYVRNRRTEEIAAAEQRGEARGREQALREMAEWSATERAQLADCAEWDWRLRALDRLDAILLTVSRASSAPPPESREDMELAALALMNKQVVVEGRSCGIAAESREEIERAAVQRVARRLAGLDADGQKG